ncbi:MAG: CDP-alcohol phosphatidyltransferase family protein [Rhodospirillum sp.]|nr:CDP-alcohol phosphatidyltransferase family protein [Rhodospirillum sp.]MCF8491408.1 CDP-alcohol phosphatidyltransferase family protein [Rhodospirillum sp.]MCF8501297.1 CDP-alcohol phosphatidyltransferase family protein [Rhodospirillum sp.]
MTPFPPSAVKAGAHRLRVEALASLCAILAVALPGYWLLGARLSLGLPTLVASALSLLTIFALVLHALPKHRHDRFGLANMVTAVRAALVSFLGATVLCAPGGQALAPALPTVLTLAVVALALDGLDGSLARHFHVESDLGARFDMEIDALLILVLSAAALTLGKAGWWVLLIGLMRYGFVLAQHPWPALRAPLPPSFRRKAVCVVQGGALCVGLLPQVSPSVSAIIAACALALLTASFAIDTVTLARRKAPIQ